MTCGVETAWRVEPAAPVQRRGQRSHQPVHTPEQSARDATNVMCGKVAFTKVLQYLHYLLLIISGLVRLLDLHTQKLKGRYIFGFFS